MAAPALRTRPGLLPSSRQSVSTWQRLWVPGGRYSSPIPFGARQASSRAQRAQMQKRLRNQKPAQSPAVESKAARILDKSSDIRFLLPGVFARPPFLRFPRSPKPFFRFTYLWLKQRFMDVGGRFAYQWSTKPSVFKGPKFKTNRRQIVATAKAMHTTMSEAFARGDKLALQRVCTTEQASRLTTIIERRPRGKRFGWELVRYNKTWMYPRIVDDKVAMLTEGSMVRQAVVAIASRQRRVEYDDSPQGGGRVVPDSVKEADLVEYVVLVAAVDVETSQQKEWRLFGTIGATTLKGYESEAALMKEAEESELSKYKT